MNINKEQTDDLNLVVTIEINKDDYESKVDEALRNYRRKANMPGFRPGKVPEGMIRKMYGKAVLVDEINKIVSESLQNYINEEQLQVLGDPIPSMTGEELDWEIGNDFSFGFEMGLAPVVEIDLSKDDKLKQYSIKIDKELLDKEIDNYSSRFGQFVDTDSVVDFKEKLTGDIIQLSDNTPVENGLMAEDTSVILSLIKDEEHKAPFKDAKTGDEVVFNLFETFPNDWEIVSILKLKNKEDVGDIKNTLFRFTIKQIQKFENAEINQDLFDKVFGEGSVNGLEEFEGRLKEELGKEFDESTMAKFGFDAREYLMEKINPSLPEAFLHKWLWSLNKDKVDETSFDREFPIFLKNMKWDLISQAIARQKEFKVEEQEIIDFAKESTKRQFAQYGVTNFPDDALTNYAMGTLKDEKNVRQFISQIIDKKVINAIHEAIDVDVEELTLDEFNKKIYPDPELPVQEAE